MSEAATKTEKIKRKGSLTRDERLVRAAFIAPAVVYLMFMSIFPFIYSVYLSLYQAKLTRLHKKFFVGFENYVNLFKDEVFLASLKNTFVLTTTSIVFEVILAFACAKVFLSLKEQKTGYFLRSMSILPMMITPLCVALIFSYILNPTLGILNYILSGVGVEPISWFANPNLALWSIIAINVWQWTPFMMLLMLAGLVSIPSSLYEAASLEKARWWHVARWIELPAIKDVILIGIILRVIDNLKLFDLVYITTRGGPGDNTELLTYFTYRQDFAFFNVGYGSAAAVIILVISIFVTTIAVSFLRKMQNA
ncbi:sugar ABC transporter permease [Alphaproteobacteria bacterium US3C007]|nr:sugar ABC transporter permease [Alphaproteobacteria bacterium US3C007]